MTGSAIPMAFWALSGAVLCPPLPLPAVLGPGVRAELQRCLYSSGAVGSARGTQSLNPAEFNACIY